MNAIAGNAIDPYTQVRSLHSQFSHSLVEALPSLYRFARRCCRNSDDAADLVQATCEKALDRWKQWHGKGELSHWLIKILVNEWRDELRFRNLRMACALDERSEPLAGSLNAVDTVYFEQVLDASERLPTEQLEILDLVVDRGLSYREVALHLGIPIGTVMSRLSRARKILAGMQSTDQ